MVHLCKQAGKQAAAGKQQQASSSRQAAAGKKKARSSSKQQPVAASSSSKQQQAAASSSKQQQVDDPRSSMLNPMTVKRILNAKGTALPQLLSRMEGNIANRTAFHIQEYELDLSTFQTEISMKCQFPWVRNKQYYWLVKLGPPGPSPNRHPTLGPLGTPPMRVSLSCSIPAPALAS